MNYISMFSGIEAVSNGGVMPAVAFDWQSGGSKQRTRTRTRTRTSALSANQTPAVLMSGVRRLMPVECERLQGFPDHHTAITYRGKPAKDGPRYKAIGNSMAVPVVRWILNRIEIITNQFGEREA